MSTRGITVILPMYNEEKHIEKTLQIVFNYISKKFKEWEIIIIDDCSVDNSYSIVNDFIKDNYSIGENIILLRNVQNRGKGFSIKRGLHKGEGDYFLVIDCDLSADISEIDKTLKYINNFDIIIGSRYLKDSVVIKKQSQLRIIYSRVYNLLIRILFRINVFDSQCGMKIFNRVAKKLIISNSVINRFSFDVECLLLAKKYNLKVKECPIYWSDNKPQKVKLSQVIEMFLDLIRIKMNQMLGNYK